MTRKLYKQSAKYKAQQKVYAREYNRLWPEKGILNTAKIRCFSANSPKFPRYGGRFAQLGVKPMDERYRWGDGNQPGYKCLIEDLGRANGRRLNRIDNDLGYIVGNLEWTTTTTNNRNRSTTKKASIGNETLTFGEIMDLAFIEILGVKYPIRKAIQDALGHDVILTSRPLGGRGKARKGDE